MTELPDYAVRYFDELAKDRRGGNLAQERKAFADMSASIASETNADIRRFMEGKLADCCNEKAMLLSYVRENLWQQWAKERRALHRAAQPVALLIDLEDIVARFTDASTYTQNPSRGRKALTIPGNYSPPTEVHRIDPKTPPPSLLNSFYKFGSHRFMVGRALKAIIDHLEERYGLDFKKLEQARQSNSKS